MPLTHFSRIDGSENQTPDLLHMRPGSIPLHHQPIKRPPSRFSAHSSVSTGEGSISMSVEEADIRIKQKKACKQYNEAGGRYSKQR